MNQRSATSGNRGWVSLFAIIMLIVIGLPLAGIALLSWWDSTNKLSTAEPVWVHPLPADGEIRSNADVVLTWSVVPPLLAPNWAGLVTAVPQISDAGISSGDPVATVDGVVRLAIRTEAPFFRALSLDDSGADVTMLNGFLTQRGLDARADDYFGYATLNGVRQFAASIGVPNAGTVGSFDPSWLVYLPEGAEKVPGVKITIDLGGPAPAAGTEVVDNTLRLVSGVLTEPGAVITETAGAAADIDVTRPVTPFIPESAKTVLPDGAVVQYAGAAIAVDGSSALTADASAALARVIPPGTAAIKAVTLTQAQSGSVLVPSAAVFASPAGKLCVIRRSAGGVGSSAVDILSNSAGKSIIVGTVAPDDEVLVSPPAGQRQCA
ncbi:MAG: peptidoglycan-binding domain-containing protein [Rhodoglobus sp.]